MQSNVGLWQAVCLGSDSCYTWTGIDDEKVSSPKHSGVEMWEKVIWVALGGGWCNVESWFSNSDGMPVSVPNQISAWMFDRLHWGDLCG